MAHQVETMAYAGEVPWHGLGNKIKERSSIDTMVKAAGLDWEVEQHDCYTTVNGKKVPIGRKALVRESDHRILTITGENWKPLQNREALEFFRDYTSSGGAKLETAGSLRDGKVIWGLASLEKGYTLKGGDKSKGYILLVSPHEVGKAITARATSIRVVCNNTLQMASREEIAYSQSHLREFDQEAARATIQLANDQIAQLALESKALQGLKMSEFDTVRALAKFFQPVEEENSSDKENAKRVQELIDDPTIQRKRLSEVLLSVNKAPGATPGNAWGVLNGVTHWADHVAGRETDARMFRSWLGHTGKTKEKVKNHLLELAQ